MSCGTVVNQVQRDYNGLGQLITEYQATSGSVNTSTTPKVQYAYSEMSGGANHSRLTSMTYPNGRVINNSYGSGLDTAISRLTSLTDSGITLESYDYLGLNNIVRRGHAQTGVDLTYIKQSGESIGDAGDQYTGLDRFGRIIDQRWLKVSDGSHVDRFQYGYDRSGNRLFEKNLVDATFSELYHANGASSGYDSLNQVSEFRRGTLSDANSDGVPDTVATASRSQSWSYDPLGNWSSATSDGVTQSRNLNKQNQITSITNLTTPTYDANGNMTGDENGKTLIYDAWNRLVAYKNGGALLESYAYDAQGRRVSQGTSSLYYSAEWQVIEERDSGVARVQQVWSPIYVDAMIERDRDSDSNGSLEERVYAIQDANFDVRSIINTSGSTQERFTYDAFGLATVRDAAWAVKSGGSTFAWVYLHQGGRLSTLSNLYSFRNRDYSANLGRWTVTDPIQFQSNEFNFYAVIVSHL